MKPTPRLAVAGTIGVNTFEGQAGMGWQDRRYDSPQDSRWKRAFRRVFVEGDNFFSWAVPLFTVPRGLPWVGGIAVKIHVFYILFIVLELLASLRRDAAGVPFAAAQMGTLFVLVLLHEFGHCIACRKVGGEADRILMWPLGGLAFARPPHNWRASLITTLGGPGVNVLLIPVLGGVLLLFGAPLGTLYNFHPFAPYTAIPRYAEFFTSYFRIWLWLAYYMNLALLLFNMLLPMFPMDAGRVLQELLWRRMGWRRSMTIAVNVGLVLAMSIGLGALVLGANHLFSVAFFCGFSCFMERQRLQMMGADEPWATSLEQTNSENDRLYKLAQKRQAEAAAKARAHESEVNRILDKIAKEGMGSLTRKEKAVLEDETARKRTTR